MMVSSGIEVRNITLCYPQATACALQDASLSLAPGSLTALVGANGAGKSTLFKVLVGLVRPQTGSVSYDGLGVREALRRNMVGYVAQRDGIDDSFPLSVEDVVMMGRYGYMGLPRRPSDQDRRAVDAALERVDLSDLRHRQVSQLSGGQSKRMFVARGIAQGARFMLLDEPFAGVDKRSESTLAELLGELAYEGTTVLAAVHDLRMAARSFDHAVLLDRTVVCQGPAREVLAIDHVARAFYVNQDIAREMVA